MNPYDECLNELATTYTLATGNPVTLFDLEFNRLPNSTSTLDTQWLSWFGYDEIEHNFRPILAGIIQAENDFETFVSHSGFIYNIHLLRRDQQAIGLAVTDPVLTAPLTPEQAALIADEHDLSLTKKTELQNQSTQLQIMPWERIGGMGKALQLICRSIAQNHSSVHSPKSSLAKQLPSEPTFANLDLVDGPLVQFSSDLYALVKDIIQAGDTPRMVQLTKRVDLTTLPLDHLAKHLIPSMKHSVIVYATTFCMIAIESAIPFETAIRQLFELCRRLDAQNDPKQIVNVLQEAPIIFCELVEQQKRRKVSKLTRQILEYVKTNYRNSVTMEELSHQTGRNKQYLSGIIKRETGLSLPEHINQLRISDAKSELIQTRRPIADIARDAGYTYPNHFSIVFRKMTGLTPSEYRNRFSSVM